MGYVASGRGILYYTALKNPSDFERVGQEMTMAHSQDTYYSAHLDMQDVLWFEEIIAKKNKDDRRFF